MVQGKKSSFTGGKLEKELFTVIRRDWVSGPAFAERSFILPGNEYRPSGL
jgi:hypothetical protein